MRNSEATSCFNLIENVICNIRRVLTKDLVDSSYYDNVTKYKKSKNTKFVLNSPLYGHSKHAVEAFFYILKNKLPFEFDCMYAKDMYNNGYWWIEPICDKLGKLIVPIIIDCTYGCYTNINEYPYNIGVENSVELSKKGRIVIERVMEIDREKVNNRWHNCNFEIAKIIETV